MELPVPENILYNWSFSHRAFYQLVKFVVPRFTRSFFQFEVNDLHHIDEFPEGTPVLFCSNHRSHLDAIIFASALVEPYGNRRTCGFMASGEAMSNNKFFRFVKYLGAFPIYPENPIPALDFAHKLLKQKMAVFLAPQGKRIYSTPYHDYFNLIKEGKTGIGRLILRLNGKIPVIPCYIKGTAEALPRGKLIPKFKARISISLCEPLLFDEYSKKRGWNRREPEFFSTAREIVEKIMVSIRDKMIIEEKHFFNVLEKKFGAPIDKIQIAKKYKKKFNDLLFKLLTIHPADLQNFQEKITQFIK